MIGNKFGKWVVIEQRKNPKRTGIYYLCKCECGTESVVVGYNLRIGESTQCRRCQLRNNTVKLIRHGMHATKIYSTWRGMIDRCDNPNRDSFYNYGGRGIKVCERWYKFENFIEDMGIPKEGLTIDRINNDGNYEPGNCRWVTIQENLKNRRKRRPKDQITAKMF